MGKDEDFTVRTQGAGGQGRLDVKILSPSRRPIPCKLESNNEVHTVTYIPPEEGAYRVDISLDGNPVPGSPFAVEGVLPPDASKVSERLFAAGGCRAFRAFRAFRALQSERREQLSPS